MIIWTEDPLSFPLESRDGDEILVFLWKKAKR